MSLPVFTWVLDYSDERLGNRLVLLALAEFAHDDGSKAYPSNATLMRRTRLSERAVRACLRSLEESGSIRFERELPSKTRVYTIAGPFNGGADSAGREGRILPQGGAANGSDSAPDPSSTRQPTRSSSSTAKGRVPTSVDGKNVTAAEGDLAVAVLGVFSAVATEHSDRAFSFGSKEAAKKVILRHREHPDLDLAAHEAIIRGQFEHPWWKGDPSPSVVYGNGDVFDRALNGVRGDRQEKKGLFDEYDG